MIFFCPSDNVYYNIVRVLTTEGKCQHVFPVRLNQRESEFAQNIGKLIFSLRCIFGVCDVNENTLLVKHHSLALGTLNSFGTSIRLSL